MTAHDRSAPHPDYGLGRSLAEARGSHLYAHTPDGKHNNWHVWSAHAVGVAKLAGQFGEAFGAASLCYLAGLLHDAGKVTAEVQEALIRRATDAGRKLGVPHKVEGAALAGHLAGQHNPVAALSLILSMLGHHTGIPNRSGRGTPLSGKDVLALLESEGQNLAGLQNKIEEELGVDLDELARALTIPTFSVDPTILNFEVELFIRMCHSALADADFLDTAAHFGQHPSAWVNPTLGMNAIVERFHDGYSQRFANTPTTPRAALRRALFDSAVRRGRERRSSAIFRMAAPTGSGKTLSALAFALEHAVANSKRRVIMAVPFTSITTQNAQVLRDILADTDGRVVLEHHSAIENADVADDWWRRLGAQNWDAEVVVTTTVQLFDSLFSSRPSSTRKLHRLAGSVVIIDEVQAMPLLLVPSILRMLRELVERYDVSVVLASATQPSFWNLKIWEDLPVLDIYDPEAEVPGAREHVRFDIRTTSQSWDAVAEELAARPQALAIVNTTPDARILFNKLTALTETPVLHLSTRMCGEHRSRVLARIHRLLAAEAPVLLVSTQLVEAGVDVDFPAVFRALAPADSLLQAAGRCNREGLLTAPGEVVIFRPDGGGSPGGLYDTSIAITMRHLRQRPESWGTDGFMKRYYDELYSTQFPAGSSSISQTIDRHRSELAFQSTAETFRMIEDTSASVVITRFGGEDEQDAVLQALNALRADPGRALDAHHRRLLTRFSAQVPRSWLTEANAAPLNADMHEWIGEYDRDTGVNPEEAAGVTMW